MKRYTEPKVIKLTIIQSQTLKKLKTYGINPAKFIRDAISEKIERERINLVPKIKEKKPPF